MTRENVVQAEVFLGARIDGETRGACDQSSDRKESTEKILTNERNGHQGYPETTIKA